MARRGVRGLRATLATAATITALALTACGSSGSPTAPPGTSAGSSRAASGTSGGVPGGRPGSSTGSTGGSPTSSCPSGSASGGCDGGGDSSGTSGGATDFRITIKRDHIPTPPPAVAGDNYDFTATIQGCRSSSGAWTFTGKYDFLDHPKYGGDSDNPGWVLDMKGFQQPDGANLLLGFAPTPAQQRAYGASVASGQGHLVLHDPSGAATVEVVVLNGYNKVIATLTLAGTAGTPSC